MANTIFAHVYCQCVLFFISITYAITYEGVSYNAERYDMIYAEAEYGIILNKFLSERFAHICIFLIYMTMINDI